MDLDGWVYKLDVCFCVWQLSGKTYCFLPLTDLLAMPNFFSAKYMFAMVLIKECSRQNSAICLPEKL